MVPPARRADQGKPNPPAPGVRTRITEAAFELFADQGYEATTVEAITQRAGVARRTFFRYFRSKDDVIFPDHQQLLEDAASRLRAGSGLTPMAAVCDAARLVFDSYVSAPERSVARYRLTRSVPDLRDREISCVEPYQRLFTRYLVQRVDDPLEAELGAAAVVAAHNHVLRAWLRDGGTRPAGEALEAALAFVLETFEPARARPGRRRPRPVAVVAVIETSMPAASVASRLRGLF
jgi:AcrR family transcriptional regulator